MHRYRISIQNPEVANEVFLWDTSLKTVIWSTGYPTATIDAQQQAIERVRKHVRKMGVVEHTYDPFFGGKDWWD